MSNFFKWSILLIVIALLSIDARSSPIENTMSSTIAEATELSNSTPTASSEVRPDFEHYFQKFNLVGSFTLYDYKASKYIRYNPQRSAQRFIPASTFKIMNSLVGLETGVVTDENFVIKWDGTQFPYSTWNHDQTLQSAITNSVVWYYQEVAQRVGRERMQHYIDAVGYGNQDISGSIDSFWLNGPLRISAEEQINFLVRLYKGDLPFSERTMEIVKKILVIEKTNDYTIRAKTGSGIKVIPPVGWWVGYVEENNNVYFFATTVESPRPDDVLTDAKINITRSILKDLGLLSTLSGS